MLDIKELPDTIQGSIVYNPFDPSDRKDVFLQHSKGQPLAFYVSDLPDHIEWTVLLNGREVPAAGLPFTFPKPGDHIIATPVPEGGGSGDGKAVLALVATLALSVFAPIAGSAIAGALKLGGSTIATTLATAAVSIAGGLLINALIPAPDTGGDTPDAYGIDGPKNTSTEGIPFPIIYGEHAFGGNYIDLHTENATDAQGESIQILSGRVMVSEGPIESISSFYINDQPIDNFNGVQIDTRLGNASQTPGGWFNGTMTLVNQGRELNTTWQTYTTSQEVDRIRFDVAAPTGMVRRDKRGKNKRHGVTVEMQYSPAGQNAWVAVTGENAAGSHIEAASNTPIRRSFWTPVLPEGFYDVRFRRAAPDSTDDKISDLLILTDIGEYIAEQTTLPYVAWAAFRTQLTGQLNGVPSFTGIARGIIMPIYNHRGQVISQSWSNNPADIVLDMYLNRRYGGAYDVERIDFAAHSEWRDYCAANGLTFNGIFFESENLDDALKKVYIAGRAQRVSSGAKISVAIDKPTGITMMFGAGNIRKGSLSISYLPFADRINDLEIAFNDEADRYKRHVVRVTNDAALNRGEELMSSTIELKGVTSYQRALREGIFRMNYNRLVNRTAEWESPIEAVGCAVGDVVTVQAEMMGWGVGGRLLKDSTTTVLNLDRPVTFEPGQSYRVLIHQNMRVAGTRSVISHSGNIITLSGAITEDEVSSIYVNSTGAEYGITRKIDDTTFILTENAIGANLGTAGSVEVRVHDQVDEVDVVNPAAGAPVEAEAITLSTPLSGLPMDYANFIFGAVTSSSRPFRVKSISRPAEGFVSLTGVEYVEEVYSDVSSSVVGSLPPQAVSHVTNLTIQNQLIAIEGGFASSVVVTWESGPTGIYVGAEVQASINGQSFATIGRTSGTTMSFSAEAGDSVVVRVMAIDYATNTPLAPQNAPTASIVVTGVSELPAAPTGVSANPGVSQITLGWNQNTEVDLRHYEIYESETNTAPGMETPATFVASGTTFVRTALTPNLTRHYWVRAVDFSGNRSFWSAGVSATTTGYGEDLGALPVPTNLTLTTEVISDGRSRVTASWDAVPNVTIYELEFLVSSGFAFFTTTTTSYSFEVPPNTVVQARVRAMGLFNIFGDYTGYASITSARDLAPPPVPANLAATAGVNQVFLNWDASTATDLSHYDIYGNDTGVAPDGTTPTELQTRSNFTSMPDLVADVTYHFWVRAVDTSGNRSAWSLAASVAPFVLEVPTDNLVGQIVSSQIADAAITTSKFASGIRPIEIVSSLPTTGNFVGRTVFLTTNNKQYRHTGSPLGSAGFTASVASGDISGQVQASQIAALEASKITGQITNTQISDNAITTPKIAAGAVTAGTIAAGSVQATKIAANAVTAEKVAANAITADKIDANAVTAGKIAAGAVSATQIAAEAITASKVAIGDFTNLILNDQLDTYDGWIVDSQVEGPINGISNMVSRRVAVIPNTITASRYIRWDKPVQANKTYFMSAEVSGSGSAPILFSFRFIIQWRDRNGAVIISNTEPRPRTDANAVTETWSATAPANAVSATFIFGRLLTANETGAGYIGSPVVRVMGDGDLIVDGAITASKIMANAVTSEKIQANAVVANKIAANAVIADKIAANAVTADKIAANTITANKIAANTITGDRLAAANIITSSAQIADAVITSAKIGNLQVDSAKIADLTVGTNKITDGATSATAAANGNPQFNTGWVSVAGVGISCLGNRALLVTVSGVISNGSVPTNVRVLRSGEALTQFTVPAGIPISQGELGVTGFQPVSFSYTLMTTSWGGYQDLFLQVQKSQGDNYGNATCSGTVTGLELKK